MAIGIAAKCKINANIGNSQIVSDVDGELVKLRACLSTARHRDGLSPPARHPAHPRRAPAATSTVPLGTVPTYKAIERFKRVEELTAPRPAGHRRGAAKQGVDYMTIHARGSCGDFLPLASTASRHRLARRRPDAQWNDGHRQGEPWYTHFDDLCEIFQRRTT